MTYLYMSTTLVEIGLVNIPIAIQIMDFRCPEVGRVIETRRGFEQELRFGVVPVSQDVTAIQGYVLVVCVCHIVVAIMAEYPSAIVSF